MQSIDFMDSTLKFSVELCKRRIRETQFYIKDVKTELEPITLTGKAIFWKCNCDSAACPVLPDLCVCMCIPILHVW